MDSIKEGSTTTGEKVAKEVFCFQSIWT